MIGFFVVFILTLAPFAPTFQYQKPIELNTVDAKGACVTSKGPCASEITAAGNWATNASNLATNITNTAQNTITAWATGSLQVKEYAWDAIAWGVINLVLEQMIRSVTEWVNAGFPDGGPAFVQDLGGFLMDIADGLAGDFIWGSPLGFMCSPFELDVRLALSAQYLFGHEIEPNNYQPKCRLSDVLSNIDNFAVNVDGSVDMDSTYNSQSFAAGGWAWWLESSRVQENNVYGAYAAAQANLAIVLRNGKGEETELLKWGQGFLSFKQCDPPDSKENCSIITPGQVIESQLNKALAGGQERLTVADEINELIAALFAYLVNQVLSEVGLLGTTQSSYTADDGTTFDSYFDAIGSDSDTVVGFSVSDDYATSYVDAARNFQAKQDEVIALYNQTVTIRNNIINDFPSISLPAIPNSLVSERNRVNDSTYEYSTANVNTLITQLETLQAEYEAADINDQPGILTQIQNVQAQLPGIQDTLTLDSVLRGQITSDLNSYYDEVADAISAAGGDPDAYLP